MGVETFDWQARRKATPGSDPGPIKRGAGFSFMMFRAALGMSSAVVQVDAQQHYTVFVGVTDVGPGAKTTIGMMAAEALGVPLSQVTGTTRIVKYVAVHESGRIINPQTARDQIRGAVMQGIGQALHEDLLYDPVSGQPLTSGYYRARHLTHLDVPTIEVHFLEVDDGYGPFGAKIVGESGIILTPAAVANAIFNATGIRMTSLPMTRDKLLGALR
jgi:CO/xanthine dehydrogenase Mo-binding subunit